MCQIISLRMFCIQHFGQRATKIIRGADWFTESEIRLDGLHPVLKKGGVMLACILFTSCMQKTNRLDIVARCSPKGMKKSLSLYRVQ